MSPESRRASRISGFSLFPPFRLHGSNGNCRPRVSFPLRFLSEGFEPPLCGPRVAVAVDSTMTDGGIFIFRGGFLFGCVALSLCEKTDSLSLDGFSPQLRGNLGRLWVETDSVYLISIHSYSFKFRNLDSFVFSLFLKSGLFSPVLGRLPVRCDRCNTFALCIEKSQNLSSKCVGKSL